MIGLGVMSGSSLDGIDMVLVELTKESYRIIDAKEFALPSELKERLKASVNMSIKEFLLLETDYSKFVGNCINDSFDRSYDFISVHGHTTFHLPSRGISNQIINGGLLSAMTEKKVVVDFRIGDIALNGVGTPLVSIAEKFLFKGYDQYLNLGGIANLTKAEGWLAFDVCPCNQLSNYVARNTVSGFDLNGELGAYGDVNEDLYKSLDQYEYYNALPPKSLDNNWISNNYFDLLDKNGLSLEDKLATIYEWVSDKILENLKHESSLFVTGGGVHNKALLKLIKGKAKIEKIKTIIPDKEIINFKESILMAYLGYLRINNNPNILSSVTGARLDSIGGAIYNVHGQ